MEEIQRKNTYEIIFSPTGGTERVMKILGQEFPAGEKLDLTQMDAEWDGVHFTAENLCLVGVPSYGGRVPATALDRIRRMRGNGAKAVMVVVYGNRAYDDTLLELEEELAACGFAVVGAIAAVAEHSIMHQYGTGRPDADDAQELLAFARELRQRLNTGRQEELKVPGNKPYREYGGVPLKPQANKSCGGCGACAAQCPVGAIPAEDPAATDTQKCISCMRCISVCTRGARTLDKEMLSATIQKLEQACSGRKKNERFL